MLTTPWDNGVRTLLPPTRTSQLNVYEASGVDRAFGHKYELSAVNAPSRVDEDRKETERRPWFYSKTSSAIEPSTDFDNLIRGVKPKTVNKNINTFNLINAILIKWIIRIHDYKSDIFSHRITKSNNTIYYNSSYQINASLLNLIMQVIKYMIADLLNLIKRVVITRNY